METLKELLFTSVAVAIGVFWGLFWWFFFLYFLDMVLPARVAY